jgi:hypothetical protein
MGGKGNRYCIEATTNLSDWSCIAQLTNSGSTVPFNDSMSIDFASRFYRALKQ